MRGCEMLDGCRGEREMRSGLRREGAPQEPSLSLALKGGEGRAERGPGTGERDCGLDFAASLFHSCFLSWSLILLLHSFQYLMGSERHL